MLCQFQVYNKLIQLYIYSFFFRFFSHIGYYRILSRVSVLYSRFLLVIYFIDSGVCMPQPILYQQCIQSENLTCLGSMDILTHRCHVVATGPPGKSTGWMSGRCALMGSRWFLQHSFVLISQCKCRSSCLLLMSTRLTAQFLEQG